MYNKLIPKFNDNNISFPFNKCRACKKKIECEPVRQIEIYYFLIAKIK